VALRFVVIDGCPCPKPLYPLLRKLKAETGCTFNSIYRGDDALALLHANGKHSQREIANATSAERAAWGILGTPNPAGRSTHELFSDGVAYKVPVGRKLKWWQCGIDIDDAHISVVMEAAKRHGWKLKHPYKAGVEFHHLNFARRPTRWRAFFRHVFGPAKTAVEPTKPAPKPPKGKPQPQPADVLGEMIDVSEAQGDINWGKVGGSRFRKSGIRAAVCKATEGTTWTDSRFSGARLNAMQLAGLRVGVYHFARPDNNKPSDEAKHFVNTVRAAGGKFISYEDWKAGKPGIVGWLDFEHEPFSREWAAAFGKAFEKLTGVKCGLYGYGSSINPVLGALKHFFGIWFAAYVEDWKPYLEAHHDRVLFWQYTSAGRAVGVSGDVDRSHYLKG